MPLVIFFLFPTKRVIILYFFFPPQKPNFPAVENQKKKDKTMSSSADSCNNPVSISQPGAMNTNATTSMEISYPSVVPSVVPEKKDRTKTKKEQDQTGEKKKYCYSVEQKAIQEAMYNTKEAEIKPAKVTPPGGISVLTSSTSSSSVSSSAVASQPGAVTSSSCTVPAMVSSMSTNSRKEGEPNTASSTSGYFFFLLFYLFCISAYTLMCVCAFSLVLN